MSYLLIQILVFIINPKNPIIGHGATFRNQNSDIFYNLRPPPENFSRCAKYNPTITHKVPTPV